MFFARLRTTGRQNGHIIISLALNVVGRFVPAESGVFTPCGGECLIMKGRRQCRVAVAACGRERRKGKREGDVNGKGIRAGRGGKEQIQPVWRR